MCVPPKLVQYHAPRVRLRAVRPLRHALTHDGRARPGPQRLRGARGRGQMRAMRNLTTLLTIVGLAALGSSSLADKPSASSPVVGKPAPDFALKDLSGNEV